MIKHYTYDGLGRLVRTQSPFPTPNTAKGMVRSERFYYDGIRRIQETRLDPVKSLAGALESDVQDEQLLGQAGAEPDPIGSSPWRVSQTGVSSGATVHGRFMQADPNGTGALLLDSEVYFGVGSFETEIVLDPVRLMADGSNLYSYLSSSPLTDLDPSGLMGFFGALSTSFSMANNVADAMDMAFTGVTLQLQLAYLANEYDAAIDMTVDWASDWSQPDDAYARSASWAMGTGYWADEGDVDGRVDSGLLLARDHDHHGFPQEFRKQFKRIGIDVDNPKYRAKLKDTYHLKIVHGSNKGRKDGAYNKFWEEFHQGLHGPRTKANAIQKLNQIKRNGWRIPKGWR